MKVCDCHTTGDKPHLSAENIVEYYNFIWSNLIPTKGSVQVISFARLSD